VKDRDSRTFFDADDKTGYRIAAALAAEGVIGRAMPQGDILGFAPPMCLSRGEADIVVAATRKAVAAVLG
jgi:L-2,4-diaminobutyrate transaminase